MPGRAEYAPYPRPVHRPAMPEGRTYLGQKTSQRPFSCCRSLRRSFNSLLTNPQSYSGLSRAVFEFLTEWTLVRVLKVLYAYHSSYTTRDRFTRHDGML